MGLFDKLKNIMNISSDTVDPLQDEIVKKYYDIIYDMRMSRGWFGEEIADVNSRSKRYIELVLGGACDEGRFFKAVELINLSNTDHPSTKLEERMVAYRNSLYQEYKAREYKSTYSFDIKTICEACYVELLAEIKSAYEAVLNIISNNVNCKHFGEGLKRIIDKYRDAHDSQIIEDCLCVTITDSFFEGNKITKKVLFVLLVDMLNNKINNPKPYTIPYMYTLHSFALSAIHFENYGKKQDGYQTVTDDEYLEFVSRANVYAKKINDRPFDKEKCIQEIIGNIKESTAFSKYNSSFYDDYSCPCVCWLSSCSQYFLDALNNYAWKEMRKDFTECTNDNNEILSESTDPEDITTIAYNYATN